MLVRPLLVLALLAAGVAHAQMKAPSERQSPPVQPSAPVAPAAAGDTPSPVVEAKQAAAAKSAEAWLQLIDSGDYGKAWDESAALFRERVTRQQWVDGLPKDRSRLGKLKTRKLEGVAYRTSMPGAPAGEYVLARFLADYEQRTAVEELVSLMYVNGSWRPIGYGTR